MACTRCAGYVVEEIDAENKQLYPRCINCGWSGHTVTAEEHRVQIFKELAIRVPHDTRCIGKLQNDRRCRRTRMEGQLYCFNHFVPEQHQVAV